MRTQLASLVDQTMPIDEVIVCDEGSTDKTLEILAQYQSKLPLIIHQNPERLGTYRNFEKAISLCTGDYIFPADQDDFWDIQKIERISTYFDQHPEFDVVFTDAVLVDEFGQVSKDKLWATFRFREQQQKEWKAGKALEILLDGNRVTGCTMGLRKSFFPKIAPFPANLPSFFLHDAWMAIAAACENRIGFIPASYVQYRQHSEQQVGVRGEQGKAPTLWDRMKRPHEEKTGPYLKKYNFLVSLRAEIEQKFPGQSFEALDAKIDYWYRRSHLPNARFLRIKKVMQNLLSGNYHRFADIDAGPEAPFLMLLGDLLE